MVGMKPLHVSSTMFPDQRMLRTKCCEAAAAPRFGPKDADEREMLREAAAWANMGQTSVDWLTRSSQALVGQQGAANTRYVKSVLLHRIPCASAGGCPAADFLLTPQLDGGAECFNRFRRMLSCYMLPDRNSSNMRADRGVGGDGARGGGEGGRTAQPGILPAWHDQYSFEAWKGATAASYCMLRDSW
eukprot:365070-Chlamydomonas_euryale.AAC.8